MATDTGRKLYNVGGVMLKQPFKIRRLGHFGFNVHNMEECVVFYRDLLGFKVSDENDFKANPSPQVQEWLKDVENGKGYFMRYGADHHAFVLFNAKVMNAMAAGRAAASGNSTEGMTGAHGININQITWQTGALSEVIGAYHYFNEREVPIMRVGRDMPGSNWHVYCYDPDGHVNELYYGIEQEGWNGRSKPRDMYYRGFREEPGLPQMSEEDEVDDALAKGIDIQSGYRSKEMLPQKFEVGGVMIARPFKITKIGPVNLFVKNVGASIEMYTEDMGFTVTEEVEYKGRRVAFLRNGAEHHTLGLFPEELRGELGWPDVSTCMSFGIEVGSYQQLKDAVTFLKENGVRFLDLPAELHPGIDYSVYALDPDGNGIMLYYYMEQLGWDGKPRPAELRRVLGAEASTHQVEEWPEALEPLSDTYVDQVFQGPIG